MKYKYSVIYFLFLSIHAIAQPKINFGLTRPQEISLLPNSKGSIDKPILKATIAPSLFVINKPTGTYLLDKGWMLIDQTSLLVSGGAPLSKTIKYKDWYNAVVPGTVLTSLVKQGLYPDPYIGLNNLVIPDSLCRKDWWYRMVFKAPSMPIGKRLWLEFDGINYKAEVWLNAKLVGIIIGAFCRGRFDVTKLLNMVESNIISVHILPPPNPGIPHEQSFKAGMGPNGGQLALDGPTFISSEGWDWVPGIRDRNIGIWQNVSLHYEGDVSIVDPQIITNLPLPDTSSASISIKSKIQNHSSNTISISVVGKIDNINFSQKLKLAPYESRNIVFDTSNTAALKLISPKLWWPNGYGQQNLYKLNLQVYESTHLLDSKSIKFGIREFSYELAATFPDKIDKRFCYSPTDLNASIPLLDNEKRKDVGNRIFIPSIRAGIDLKKIQILKGNNPYLNIKVNGVSIFCKGGNWGMDDGMKQSSREKLTPAFQLHKDANFNMIRNWTGESTEEVFYELADEYGMLVWNDFWISTEGYNLNPTNQLLFLENSLDVIKRFRNHPSIAIWCPRNEGYAPIGIEDELATQIAIEDGTRHYIGNSREINLRQSGGWSFLEKPIEYYTRFAEGFTTEIGTFSIPLANTIRKFLKPEDWWPINDAWHYHDLHSNNQNLFGYLKTIDSLYGKSNNLDAFSKKVQMVNYDSHRAIFEAWNSKRWSNTSGILLWMTHPAWPSMIWQTYSSDYETFGSYYASKKACEPLHAQLNLNDSMVVVINNHQVDDNVLLRCEVFDINGKKLSLIDKSLIAISNQITKVFNPYNSGLTNLPSNYLLRLSILQNGNCISINEYWKTNKDYLSMNQIVNGSLMVKKVKLECGKKVYTLLNTSDQMLIGIKLYASDKKGNSILPALFSDGYFNLLPGEQREISIPIDSVNSNMLVSAEAYNMPLTNIEK